MLRQVEEIEGQKYWREGDNWWRLLPEKEKIPQGAEVLMDWLAKEPQTWMPAKCSVGGFVHFPFAWHFRVPCDDPRKIQEK